MTAILLVAVGCVAVVAVVSYSDSRSIIEQNYVRSLEDKMTLEMESFDSTMQEMYQNIQHISCMPELKESIDSYMKSEQTYSDGTKLAQTLSDLLTFNRFDSTLYLYLPELKKTFSSQEYYMVRDNDESSSDPWELQLESPLVPLCYINRMARSSQRVYSYAQPVYDAKGDQLATVYITIDERQLYYSLIDNLNNTDGEDYMILSEDGMICSAEDVSKLGQTIDGVAGTQRMRMDAEMGEGGMLYTSIEAPFSHYRMLCQSDLELLMIDINTHAVYFTFVMAFILIGLILAAAVASNQLYRPLEELTEAMDHVSGGDFTARIEDRDRDKDEFGVVREHFNEMVSRMDGLMEQVVQERTQKREAEINALQYQIRPHFMYNTLNSIRFAAMIQKNYKLAELLGDFIALLEASSQRKGVFLTLKEEIKLVQNYLSLQAFRYLDCFETSFLIAPETEECYVPCLLLQPMVENAVFHGIDPKRNDNRLEISSWLEQDRLHITVRDNGEGFSVDGIKQPNQEDEKRRMTGIGLQNVEQRLKLYYGDTAHFTIRSQIGEGTTVEFSLPVSYDPNEYSIRKSGVSG